MAVKNRRLPSLPKGEGSMSITERNGKEYVMYRKLINGKRRTVYADTAKECMEKMREIEKNDKKQTTKYFEGGLTLINSMTMWHDNVKKVSLKNRSWDREHHTIQNQIKPYGIANIQVRSVDSMMIQQHINYLIKEKNYSYSTVKKTYEILNQFFAYFYANDLNNNPMNRVNKPTKNGMNVVEKEIEFFDTEDLHLFVREATRMFSNGKPVYKYGYGFVVMILTFCRVGEMMALRWKNVNLEKGEIYIKEAVSKVIDDSRETKDGQKYNYKIEITTPKFDSVRTVYMNEECVEYFKRFKELQNPEDEYEWVFATQSKTLVSERNLRRCLNNIQEAAKMYVQNSGFHVLRHTGITLMARAGVDEMVVAKIAGQKDTEMIHRIYRHISETEKINAVEKVYSVKEVAVLK